MTPWYLGNSYVMDHMWSGSWFWWPWFVIPFAVWSVFWTGFALWYASRREDKGWFVFFLLVHTGGLLEILYLVFVAQIFAASRKLTKRRRK